MGALIALTIFCSTYQIKLFKDISYLSFFGWCGLVVVWSLINGAVLTAYYPDLIARDGLKAIVSITETLPLEALLILILIPFLADISSTDQGRLFQPALIGLYIVALSTGYLRLLLDVYDGSTFDVFTVFNRNQNRAAILLNLLHLVVLDRALRSPNKWFKIGLLSGLGFGILGQFMTYSRAGIGTMAFLLVSYTIGYAFINTDIKTVGKAVLIPLLVSGFLLPFLPGGGWAKITKRFTKTDTASLSDRADLMWPAAVQLIENQPVTGHAAGSFPLMLYQGSDQAKSLADQSGTLYANTHNHFLQVVYLTGVLGALLFLWFFGHFLWQCWRSIAHDTIYLAIGLTMLGVVGIQGTVEVIPWAWIAWILGVYLESTFISGQPSTATSSNP